MSLESFRRAERASRAGGTTEVYFHPGAEIDPPDPVALAALLATSD
jgi:hypothetical protein